MQVIHIEVISLGNFLINYIDDGCDSWHFYSGTFTWPKNVTAFMRTVGYYNSHSYEYNFDRVKSMLDNNSPLLIYSIPHWCVTKSHCWNIDGYKIKERIKTIKYTDSFSEQKETMKMVHCDFGWTGKNNGYYASGVFRLNDKNFESDGYNDGNKHTHYNNLLKIITYTKPVN